MMGSQPVVILKEGTTRERGRSAQSSNIMAAKAVAEAVRSTLGPKGMDKMLVDSMGDVVITNDGATILKEIDVAHPAAKMLIEVAKTQETQVGDGTTSSVVLAGALLHQAEQLIEDVHPTLITRGYRLASEKALEIVRGIAREVKFDDEKTLRYVATTAMSSKSASGQADQLADITVRAVRAVAEKGSDGRYRVDLGNVSLIKKTGTSVGQTELVEGVIVDKERLHPTMPRRVENPKIALIDCPLEIEKPEIDAKIQITKPHQFQEFIAEEEKILRGYVDRIKSTGANVVFAQKGIDDLAQHFLARNGIYAVRRVKESDMKALARATGGRVVSDLKDLTADDLGKAGAVEARKFGDDELTFVTGATGARAVSVLIRAGTEHVADEVERTLEDALGVVRSVVEDGKVLPGAGAPEIEVALGLRKYAATVGGREQLAIEAFADAVETLPRALAENAGLDAIDKLVDLRSAHERGQREAGLNVFNGKVENAWENRVIEPLRVKAQAIQSATEVATMILRIDDVIAAKNTSSDSSKGKKGGDSSFDE
ncbi:MAG TPA: thermosome subunit beta [Candidatus Thermoplasmatota archaeon]|nr:thermosome subunit beta [Candidatus Thermoplasmatota archaeon]